jgi:ribosomal protein L37AE/L43A
MNRVSKNMTMCCPRCLLPSLHKTGKREPTSPRTPLWECGKCGALVSKATAAYRMKTKVSD